MRKTSSEEEEKKVKSACLPCAVVKLKGALYAEAFTSLTLNAVKTITTQEKKENKQNHFFFTF